jgi:integrase
MAIRPYGSWSHETVDPYRIRGDREPAPEDRSEERRHAWRAQVRQSVALSTGAIAGCRIVAVAQGGSSVSIYRRKDSSNWWGEFRIPGRKAIQESSGTPDQVAAQEWHDRKKAALWREVKCGDKPARSWKAAVIRWCDECGDKADARNDAQKFAWFEQHFGKLMLGEMTRDVVMRAVNLKAQEASKATANRYLALVRAVLRRAAMQWEWLDNAPSFKQFREPTGRVRYLTPEQGVKLIKELPPHLRAMTVFALSAGLRQANIKRLRWSQVDLARRVAWIHATEAKAGQAIGVPLNDAAVAVLQSQLGKHREFVFTFGKKRPRPVDQVNTRAWRKALKRAGIENFRWHDLRHTWASWCKMNGVGDRELLELGGWKSEKMVRRYAHLSSEHLASAAAKLNGILQSSIDVPPYDSPTLKVSVKPKKTPKPAAVLAPRPGLEPGTCGLTDSKAKTKKVA